MVGNKYGDLEVWAELTRSQEQPLGFTGRIKTPTPQLLCRCKCGNLLILALKSVVTGKVIRCVKCLKRSKDPLSTFGRASRKIKDPTYNSWRLMRTRCKRHIDLIERGITVCERWNVFQNFVEDMGQRPPEKTLDRVDNSKGYYKENCRWATTKEQQNNKRNVKVYTLNGETLCQEDWGRKLGFKTGSQISRRLKDGWPLELALTIGPRERIRGINKPEHKPKCKKGHDFTPENTLWESNGIRRCRTCRLASNRERYSSKKQALQTSAKS